MADYYSDKVTVEDAKLDPTASTSRGRNISITTWVMALVLLAIVAIGALMITGLFGFGFNSPPPTRNQTSTSNP